MEHESREREERRERGRVYRWVFVEKGESWTRGHRGTVTNTVNHRVSVPLCPRVQVRLPPRLSCILDGHLTNGMS